MKTRIIVDSTADLMPEFKSRVHTVPLTVHFGQEEYTDGVTIDHKTFYEKLIETDVHPSTSQATPIAFEKEYEKLRETEDEAVVITLSSKLSGTYQSAMIAAQDHENIYVVDSGRIVEEGNHDSLVEENGLYSRMWDEFNQSIQWKVKSEVI